MVSLRRRRLLGLCSVKDCFPIELPKLNESNGSGGENVKQNMKSISVHPTPSVDFIVENPVKKSQTLPGYSHSSVYSSSKEDPDPYVTVKQTKWRKRHRRKLYQDQEQCVMRGVYFKNMKWQAAIKVDKKQIHLGTVGSQEEAARLYDRAAFICGREPNLQLTEEEKEELRRYKWEDFLAMTRSAIANKKQQRRAGAGRRRKTETPSPSKNREGKGDGGEENSFESGGEEEEDEDFSF